MWVPEWLWGAGWKREVRERGEQEARFNISLVERVRGERKRGKGERGSFVDMLIEWEEEQEMGKSGDDEGMKSLDARAMAALPATLFSGGVDTTVSTIHSAILLLLLHPDVLAIARVEIDAKIAEEGRSPSFADLEQGQLQYFQAMVQEILRLRPAVPLMLPRATTAKDTYLDYEVPEATTLFVNTYAMHNDAEYFPYPEELKPQRFLEEGHVLFEERYRGKKFPGREKHGTFGWGRRSCPGTELGKSVKISFSSSIGKLPIFFSPLICLTS
jgi:cytochrome P450